MPRKIVVVPFAYEMKHRPPRARNLREVTVRDEVALRVRELSGDDFPVALRVTDYHGSAGTETDEIRTDGLRLYKPFTYEPVGQRIHVGADSLDYAEGAPPGPFMGNHNEHWRMRDALTRQEVLGDIAVDGREAAVRALEQIANGTVIHDGKLFKACDEPAWRYSGGSFSGGHYLKPVFADSADPYQPESLVRADRLDDFLAGFPEDNRPERWGAIEVLMPQMLRLSDVPGFLASATRVNEILSGHLKEATVEQFSAYAGLRDALKECGGKATEDLLLAVDAVLDTPEFAERASWAKLSQHRERVRREIVGAEAPALAAPRR